MTHFIFGYLTRVDGVVYHPSIHLQTAISSPTTLNIFTNAILKSLHTSKISLQLSTMAKSTIDIVQPSTVAEVKTLLGCTEHCFWCGSLCWGQYGHESNCDDTKRHHACHQPGGLTGFSHRTEHYLVSEACHERGDSWKVYWGEHYEDGMLWSEAKRHKDFVGWTFTRHSKTEFNDLMKWFYLKLHERIAEWRGLLPARSMDLKKCGFDKLSSLRHILSEIKSRM